MSFAFNRTSRAVLRSLVPVICPPQYDHLADAIVDHMARTMDASPALLRTGFEAGLATYELAAIPFFRRRASKLSPEQAERYFSAWEHGTTVQYQLARALNQLMSMACYEQPEAKRDCGFEAEAWIAEVKRKRLTVFASDIAKHERQLIAPDPLRPGVKIQRSSKQERV